MVTLLSLQFSLVMEGQMTSERFRVSPRATITIFCYDCRRRALVFTDSTNSWHCWYCKRTLTTSQVVKEISINLVREDTIVLASSAFTIVSSRTKFIEISLTTCEVVSVLL